MHIRHAREGDPMNGLRFIWLELTNRCNLACVHCYAESGPHPDRLDVLTTADFLRLLDEAAEIGCRAVQFIGGEPTLHPGLPELIAHARVRGYEHVEVYTNGTHLPPALLDCFVRHAVSVAVSVYADDAEMHDAVTARRGSHRRTIANLRKLIDAGLDVRAGVIAMDANQDRVEQTMAFLRAFGVQNIGLDYARGVGRGGDVACGDAGLQALCGACWQGSLCVAPDGSASPCIMSKAWPVGSTLTSGLSEIVESAELRGARTLIRDEVWAPREEKHPETMCTPDVPCRPCDPLCNPCMPICDPICPPARGAYMPEKPLALHVTGGPGDCAPAVPCGPDQCPPRVCEPNKTCEPVPCQPTPCLPM
jgi:organic radical activating enzyme